MKVTRQPRVEKMASLNSADLADHTSLRRRADFSAEAVSAFAAAISRCAADSTDMGMVGKAAGRGWTCARSSAFSFLSASGVDVGGGVGAQGEHARLGRFLGRRELRPRHVELLLEHVVGRLQPCQVLLELAVLAGELAELLVVAVLGAGALGAGGLGGGWRVGRGGGFDGGELGVVLLVFVFVFVFVFFL